jgi:hypothetical protein
MLLGQLGLSKACAKQSDTELGEGISDSYGVGGGGRRPAKNYKFE